MRKSKNGDFLFYVAGGLLVLAFLLVWFVSSPSALEMLHYIGWIIWAVGIVLILLPMSVFHSKGRVENGKALFIQKFSLKQESTPLFGILSIWAGYSCTLQLFSGVNIG